LDETADARKVQRWLALRVFPLRAATEGQHLLHTLMEPPDWFWHMEDGTGGLLLLFSAALGLCPFGVDA